MEHNLRVAGVYLDRLRARLNHAGLRARALVLVVRDGNVSTRLERAIQEEAADLVVMSAHGQTGRTDCSRGGVTEYAVSHATTPLLVIRERIRRRMQRVDSAGARRPVPSSPAAV
jgi:nucleotide-binding universal stress UspA family protein